MALGGLGRRRVRRVLALLALGWVTASTAGCFVHEDVGVGGELVVARPPPPEVVEESGAAPGTEYVWIRGHWLYNGDGWIWRRGHWEARRAGYQWVPGHWLRRDGGWMWIEGHWRRVPAP